MGVKISQLTEAFSTIITDIFHLRTVGGIDRKIKGDNFINSILGFTTKGDFVVRGTNIPERLAVGILDSYLKGQGAGNLPIYEKLALRNTGIKIGAFTKTASATFNITDVGFEPSIIILISSAPVTDTAYSLGFDDANVHYSMRKDYQGIALVFNATYSIKIISGAGNDGWYGYISAFLSNGFTVVLTKTVVPPAITVMYLALP
ncbi:hypothetical protein LCGC14_0521560 [marine sediment metagenome]|uniref:Uncharacterized protein n=1 Tax=marine sediment metagenome TaxID=412755 RepID=A0A0F9UJV7_9ZZZZ